MLYPYVLKAFYGPVYLYQLPETLKWQIQRGFRVSLELPPRRLFQLTRAEGSGGADSIGLEPASVRPLVCASVRPHFQI